MPLYNPLQTPLSVTTKGDIQTFSTTPARLSVGSDGYYPIADSSQTTGLKYKAPDGWNEAFETWEYVSVDDPTGIFRVNADVTTKYSAGMRIKFTNATNVIYGIITVVGAYTGGYTSITFLHQIDPTDSLALYLMANSAITANSYSTNKAPFGFPLDPLSWTIIVISATFSQANAVNHTWYNIMSISVPIGKWKFKYTGTFAIIDSGTTLTRLLLTISTANNSMTDSSTNSYQGSGSYVTYASLDKEINLSLTAKANRYLNIKTYGSSGAATLATANDDDNHPRINLLCSYL